MSYKFYGHESKSVHPIDEAYKNIKDQRHLYDLLDQCWSIDTCAPRYRPQWNLNNKTLGQCSITSFLVQDIFGGEVYGVPLKEGGYHCFNVIGDITFDLTSEQFGEEELDYINVKKQTREEHFSSEEKYQRYLLLKKSLLEKIK